MQVKDYQEQVARLKEQQEFAIKETDEQIHKWKGFKSDYEALTKRLVTLPDKISHDVMVPFGKMAFMPGQLVHTNEILVLLGDNWFAERSAKQAVGIVNRRMKQIDKQLEDLDKQRKLLEPRRDFTSDLHELGRDGMETFDIREDYDEEKERKWKAKHKERVKNQRQKVKEDSLKKPKSNSTKSDIDTEAKLWERLDELERIESEGRELEKIGIEEDPPKSPQYPRENGIKFDACGSRDFDTNNRHIVNVPDTGKDSDSESEEHSNTSDELDSDDEDSLTDESASDETDAVATGGKVINFSHSINQVSASSEVTDPETIHPGSLYTRFKQPKSILKKIESEPKKIVKKKSRRRVVEFDTGSDTDERNRTLKPVQQTPSVSAFTGTVLEKQLASTSLQSSKEPGSQSGNVNYNEQSESTKPVSRFKARKQNKMDT